VIIRNYVPEDVRPLCSSQTSASVAVRPGQLLRGHVAARFRHSNRGDISFDEEGNCPGTARPGSAPQAFDTLAGVLTCERVLLIGRRLAHVSRAAERNIRMEELPAALRGVGACQVRYAVYRGALFMFEVRCGILVSAQESTADSLGIPTR
jgi:hypothetical protein